MVRARAAMALQPLAVGRHCRNMKCPKCGHVFKALSIFSEYRALVYLFTYTPFDFRLTVMVGLLCDWSSRILVLPPRPACFRGGAGGLASLSFGHSTPPGFSSFGLVLGLEDVTAFWALHISTMPAHGQRL